MGFPGSDNPDDGSMPLPSRKNVAELDVIDVDALDCRGDVEPSTEEAMVGALRHATETINVDNPSSQTQSVPSSTSGPPPQLLQFGGVLGVALFEQKTEVLEEEADAARVAASGDKGGVMSGGWAASRGGAASGGGAALGDKSGVLSGGWAASGGVASSGGAAASGSGAVPGDKGGVVSGGWASSGGAAASGGRSASGGRRTTLVDAENAVREEVMARMHAAGRTRDAITSAIIDAREKQLQMPWPPAAARLTALSNLTNENDQMAPPARSTLDSVPDWSCTKRPVARAPMAFFVPRTVAIPPPQRSLFRTDKYRSFPRVPRRGFVRKAPVMQVNSSQADPPTPLHASTSDDQYDEDAVDAQGACNGGTDAVASAAGVDLAVVKPSKASGVVAMRSVPAAVASSGALFVDEGNTAVADSVGVPVTTPSAVTMTRSLRRYLVYGGVAASAPSTTVRAGHLPVDLQHLQQEARQRCRQQRKVLKSSLPAFSASARLLRSRVTQVTRVRRPRRSLWYVRPARPVSRRSSWLLVAAIYACSPPPYGFLMPKQYFLPRSLPRRGVVFRRPPRTCRTAKVPLV